ncbi:MAG: hypothetical protein WBL88_01525, partial [Nitrososphaeraceae archaeon]
QFMLKTNEGHDHDVSLSYLRRIVRFSFDLDYVVHGIEEEKGLGVYGMSGMPSYPVDFSE